MISCRYVGGDSSEIGEREFDAVGQRAAFSEQGYREAVLGGAAFITEEDFRKISFTVDEINLHGPVGMRVDPPTSFCEKLARAQQIYREDRSRMLVNAEAVLAEASDRFGEAEPVVGLQ
jgi:hypothetical protein